MKIKRSQLKTLVREIIRRTFWMREQRLDEAQRGEWWIYPGGDAQFADGDVGDSGHEGYVIEHLSREIYEHFVGAAPDDGMGYLGDWEEDIWRALRNDDRVTEEDAETWANRGNKGGPLVVILQKLLEDKVYKDPEQTKESLYIAYGSSTRDARDYAMKYLGWKRITTSRNYGTEFQTWFLRQSDLDDMKRGIFNAWGDSGGEEEEDANHEVSIEVRANNKSFSGIPLNVFEEASVSDLVTYSRESAWMRERKSAPIIDPVNFTQMG